MSKVYEVKFIGPDKKIYKCVGVLSVKKNKLTRVSFSTVGTKTKDYIDAPKEVITSVTKLDSKKISRISVRK